MDTPKFIGDLRHFIVTPQIKMITSDFKSTKPLVGNGGKDVCMVDVLAGPSEPGGLQLPQYFATICSLNFQENIARPYYKFAKILTSSVASYPF